MKRRIIWLISLVLLVAAGGIAILVTTDAGLRWAFPRIAAAAPGALRVAQFEGRLIGPIRFAGLEYESGGATLTADSLELDWQPLALLSGTVHLTRVHGDGVELKLPDAAGAPAAGRLALALKITDLKITRARLRPTGREATALDEIRFRGRITSQAAEVDLFALRAPRGETSWRGRIGMRAPFPVDLGGDWRVSLPGFPAFQGSGQVTGDLTRARVLQRLSAPFAAELDAEVWDVTGAPRITARLQVSKFDSAAVNKDWPPARAGADIELAGNVKRWRSDGRLSLEQTRLGSLEGSFVLRGESQNLILDELKLRSPQRQGTLSARGEVRLDEESPRGKIHVAWRDLAWPPRGDTIVTSEEGTLEVLGRLERYTVKARAVLQGPFLPPGEWRLAGAGNRSTLQLDSIETGLLDGVLKGAASIDWQQGLRWQAQIAGAGLDPGVVWSGFPGRLEIDLAAHGRAGGGPSNAEVELRAVRGQLRGQPVEITGTVGTRAGNYYVKPLQIAAGAARASLVGNVDESWDLRWQFDVPDLNVFHPEARGRALSRGQLQGPRRTPSLSATVALKDAAFEASSVAQFDAEVRLDLNETSMQRSFINLELAKLLLAGRNVDGVTLRADGTIAQHTINIDFARGGDRAMLALEGAYRDANWTGILARASLADERTGNWNLEEPGPLTVSPGSARFGPWCVSVAAPARAIGGAGDFRHRPATGAAGALCPRNH